MDPRRARKSLASEASVMEDLEGRRCWRIDFEVPLTAAADELELEPGFKDMFAR